MSNPKTPIVSSPDAPRLTPLPHPALVSGGRQLDQVIAGMTAGTMPLPDTAVWRSDIPREQAIRLVIATGCPVCRHCGQPVVLENGGYALVDPELDGPWYCAADPGPGKCHQPAGGEMPGAAR